MEELEMDELERMRLRIQQLHEELAQLHHNIDDLQAQLQGELRFVKRRLSWLEITGPNRLEEEGRHILIEQVNAILDRLIIIIDDASKGSSIALDRGIKELEETIDVRRATEKILDHLRLNLRERSLIRAHILILDFAPEPLFAYADPGLFSPILFNLIVSAATNSPDGGEIRIIGRTEPASAAFPDGTLLMGVRDQGRWYSTPLLEWSQRVKNNEDDIWGDARSLCLARGLNEFLYKYIEWHGGHMWAETNEESQGITMWFRIPSKQPALNNSSPTNTFDDTHTQRE